MFFDYQQPTLLGGLAAYPDYPYSEVPRDEVGEQLYLKGTNSGRSLTINASAEDR